MMTLAVKVALNPNTTNQPTSAKNKVDDNPLPNDNFLDWSKLEAFANDKINVNDRKHCGKKGKCWLPAFSLFPTMF